MVALIAASALSLLPNFSNPVKEKEVDRTGPAVLKSLDDLADYHAATAELQTTVDIEKDVSWVPGFLAGERYTYLAIGEVDGVVDLSALDTRTVVITGTSEKVVTVTVPPPHLSKVTLDVERSKVIAHDRGLTNRFSDFFASNPDELDDVQKKSVPKLEAAAGETEILERAEKNTRTFLTQILKSAGADKVIVKFEDPTTTSTPGASTLHGTPHPSDRFQSIGERPAATSALLAWENG